MNRRDLLKALPVILSSDLARAAQRLQCLSPAADDLFSVKPIPVYQKFKVAVIGSGIAGLTAGYVLKKAGVQVKVFEANAYVGGRMSSFQMNGHVVDRGAQFFPKGFYSTLVPLVEELNLQNQLCEVSPFAAVVRDGLPRRMNTTNILTLFDELLEMDEISLPRLLVGVLAHSSPGGALAASDIVRWNNLDQQTAATWAERFLSPTAKKYLAGALVSGLSFQEPEEVSQVLLRWILGFFLRAGTLLTFKNGMGTVTEKLAAQLDVQTESPVQDILQDGLQMHVLDNEREKFSVDFVIVATPAPIANQLTQQVVRVPEEQNIFKATAYKQVCNFAVNTSTNWRKDSFKDMTFMVFPKQERRSVHSLTQDFRNFSAADEMFQFFLSPEQPYQRDSELHLRNQCLQDMQQYFPGLQTSVIDTRFDHLKFGTPIHHVGKSRMIKRYRDQVHSQMLQAPEQQRIRHVLAGDSLGFYGTDGAAYSGVVAARQTLLFFEQARKNFCES